MNKQTEKNEVKIIYRQKEDLYDENINNNNKIMCN